MTITITTRPSKDLAFRDVIMEFDGKSAILTSTLPHQMAELDEAKAAFEKTVKNMTPKNNMDDNTFQRLVDVVIDKTNRQKLKAAPLKNRF